MSQLEGPASLQAGLVETVRVSPHDIAIDTAAGAATYAELNDLALKIAAALSRAGVGRGDCVVLQLDKSIKSYAALVGVLYAGATYVPLHSLSPVDRVLEQIALVNPKAAICHDWTELAEEFMASYHNCELFILDNEIPLVSGRVHAFLEILNNEPLPEAAQVTAVDVAYIMFTSGSTGHPKAVPISHGSARFFLDAMAERYDFSSEDRFSQLFDFAFDLSVFDMFVAWDAGACICAPNLTDSLSLAEYAQRFGITIWFSVPSAAALVVRQNKDRTKKISTIRWSLFCGEALPKVLVADWCEIASDSKVENLYGPTELTIACTAYSYANPGESEQGERALVPIGKSWPGMCFGLIGEDGRIRFAGAGRGELIFDGPQRFGGYLNGATGSQAFVRVSGPNGDREFYRTGDIVDLDEDGFLHYLGRNDTQVKIDGLRVDLAEIEAVACKLAEAPLAVAIVAHDKLGLARSVRVVIEGAANAHPDIMLKFANHLPASWCPLDIVYVDEIPRNNNGKLDRNAVCESINVSHKSSDNRIRT